MHIRFTIIILSVLFSLSCDNKSSQINQIQANEKQENVKVNMVSSQSIGYYSNGKIMKALDIGMSGPGWMKLFVPRDRGFGNATQVRVLVSAAKKVKSKFPIGERLQVGDWSIEKGGKITRHASHQHGLDVDLAYYRNDHKEQDPNDTWGFREDMVQNGKLISNFDVERNWTFIKEVVASSRIQRIFVDGLIKQKFCDDYLSESTVQVLRRLRPYRNHSHHMHVRFFCPMQNSNCKMQNEPPEGSGCETVFFDQEFSQEDV